MENHGGMISTVQLIIRPTELFGNPISSHLVAKQKELAKNNKFCSTKYLFSYFEGLFNMP
jgi:hypothetical protein